MAYIHTLVEVPFPAEPYTFHYVLLFPTLIYPQHKSRRVSLDCRVRAASHIWWLREQRGIFLKRKGAGFSQASNDVGDRGVLTVAIAALGGTSSKPHHASYVCCLIMRQSIAPTRQSHLSNSSSNPAAFKQLSEKKKEFEAILALEKASTQFLRRIEGIADDVDNITEAGIGLYFWSSKMLVVAKICE